MSAEEYAAIGPLLESKGKLGLLPTQNYF